MCVCVHVCVCMCVCVCACMCVACEHQSHVCDPTSIALDNYIVLVSQALETCLLDGFRTFVGIEECSL